MRNTFRHESAIRPFSRRPIALAYCLALLAALLTCLSADGSGSYRHSALPDKSSDLYNEGVDVGRFELGRKLYAGMIKLSDADSGAESNQAQKLQELARKLPSSQSKSSERMQRMAGRLTKDQVEALEYFIQERFGNRLVAQKGK